MAESVESWWSRRQFSKGTSQPYPVGTYRSDWERYPVLVRQYLADQNAGILLTQIPPAAEVYLVWTCDVGHRFVATPAEQRARPGGERRRSTWCPDCSALAVRRAPARKRVELAAELYDCGHPRDPRRIEIEGESRCALCRRLDGTRMTRRDLLAIVTPSARERLAQESLPGRRYRWRCPEGHGSYEASVDRVINGRRCRVCANAAGAASAVSIGEAFVSPWAPRTASAAEALLRQKLAARFAFDLTPNAVRVARPFFEHMEVWPDIVIGELRVAIEYDTIGRFGLEHVGRREEVDRRKDRLLRAVGWEVVRVRVGRLQSLGPFDVHGASVTESLVDRIAARLGEIAGDLMVNAYGRHVAGR